MTITELLDKHHISKADLARRFHIPYRTVQNWTASGSNKRECPPYIVSMMDELLERDN